MAADQTAAVPKEERLKAALWYSVGKAVDEMALGQDLNTTPYFIGGLSEMLWAQIEVLAQDLESFAKHAGRTTINVEDVLLLARRNDGLHRVLQTTADELRKSSAG